MATLESGLLPIQYGLYLFAGAESMIAHTGYSSSRARVYGNNNAYIYNLSTALLKYRNGQLITVYDGMARSMVQVEPKITTLGSGTNIITLISTPDGVNTVVYHQQEEESIGGWVRSTMIPTISAEDMVGDDGDRFLSIPILIGNVTVNNYSRIVRNEDVYPFNIFTDSDAGIPQITPDIAQITDLERTSN